MPTNTDLSPMASSSVARPCTNAGFNSPSNCSGSLKIWGRDDQDSPTASRDQREFGLPCPGWIQHYPFMSDVSGQDTRGRVVFLRREALAAPEDVGGEEGEGQQEGDPDAMGTR